LIVAPIVIAAVRSSKTSRPANGFASHLVVLSQHRLTRVLRNNDGIFRSIGQAQPGAAGPCKLNTGEPDGGLRAGTREEP